MGGIPYIIDLPFFLGPWLPVDIWTLHLWLFHHIHALLQTVAQGSRQQDRFRALPRLLHPDCSASQLSSWLIATNVDEGEIPWQEQRKSQEHWHFYFTLTVMA
jgi:hypothetical protein